MKKLTTATQDLYAQLTERLEEISRLGGVMGTLHWDQEVVMPPGSAEARARQMAALAGVLHEKTTDPKLGEWLKTLHAQGPNGFDPHQWCNIREAKRDFDLETRVPKKLVQELAELSSRGHAIWAQARKDNRFSDFAPTLKRFVALKTEWAQHAHPDLSTYDANIDIYERGTTQADITPIFDAVKARLIPLIQKIADKPPPDTTFLEGEFPIEKQEALAKSMSRALGFSFDHGRIDSSVHPFCGGGHQTDVRITTRYRTDNFIESLYAVIHETGHGLYEQGRMDNDLPVSESLTMGIHESQSLFWERMIAQSRAFCAGSLEALRAAFPENFEGVSVDALYKAVNVCRPSLIRVEADEVTYPLHIILRYELEKSLFEGAVDVDALPEIWNDKMEQYLGIRPPDDALGVLQDVHWSGGSFGYFPSYTLGAMYACQFYLAMKKEMPDTEAQVENRNFSPVKDWLNANIHSQGRLYSASELTERVTGETLNPAHFIDYLENKYTALYQLD